MLKDKASIISEKSYEIINQSLKSKTKLRVEELIKIHLAIIHITVIITKTCSCSCYEVSLLVSNSACLYRLSYGASYEIKVGYRYTNSNRMVVPVSVEI